MGKKKKKQRDSWDLTAEEQMELADAFYEAEKKGQLLKLDKDGKASKFTENGLEPGIEELIHQRLVASEHKNDENLTNNTNDESETFDESVDDFDNDEESRKTATPDEGCVLVRKSKTIIINEDTFIPHMELYSVQQNDIENIIKKGIMHDIIFSG